MHAYLFIGNSESNINNEIDKMFPYIKGSTLTFRMAGIEDVRILQKSLKLAQSKPLYIKITGIDSATHEAQNAFLKNLEEPPDNISFLISATSDANILPTILSRCRVIRITDDFLYPRDELKEFFRQDICGKISTLGKITKRDAAIEFVTHAIYYKHNALKTNGITPELPGFLKAAGLTLHNLKSNGQVFLQLLNFAINAK